MIQLTDTPIDTANLFAAASSPRAGAVVLFFGTTRQWTGDRQTESLEYECYGEMAEKKLRELETEARKKWSIIECIVVHRLGHVAIGEASVAIAVSSPHRKQAFEAGSWMIDAIKDYVPIWKKENWADGTSEWVHPGMDQQEDAFGVVEMNTEHKTGNSE